MERIIRIHLAKVAYEIEVDAQEALTDYLNKIRHKLDKSLADEILADIEVRITEILSSRKVNKGDVITLADIEAVEKQLGSPAQITDSQDEEAETPADGESKKLLRDMDHAYLGGVASGLGAYFGIDPIFIRIAFVILTFFYGIGIVIYLLFLLLVPAAKSSSEKLQMSGQPVTVANLQKYRSSVSSKISSNSTQRFFNVFGRIIIKIVKIGVTVASVLATLYILGFLGVLSSFTYIYPFRPIFTSYKPDYAGLVVLWAIGLSVVGLLVTLVIRIWGKSTFRLKVGFITFLSIFLISLAATGALVAPIYNHFSYVYGNGKSIRALSVNTVGSTAPTSLVVNGNPNLNINYIVEANQPVHATYIQAPGMTQPNVSINNNDGKITVNASNLAASVPSCLGNLCAHVYLPIHVVIYGPAVSSISDNNGAIVKVNNANFGSSLTVLSQNSSDVQIQNSYADNMNLTALLNSSIEADSSTTQNAAIRVDQNSSIQAPVATNVQSNVPSVCNDMGGPVLILNGYPSVNVNGVKQPTDQINNNNCIAVPEPIQKP